MKKISIYTDKSKQEEFIERMNAIVNNQNSSIAYCVIEKNGSNGFVILVRPHNPRRSHDTLMFNFNSYLYTDNDYKEYIDKGYSKEDITQLATLLNDFCFENFYEGQFFASTFLKLTEETLKSYVFKLNTDEKNHIFLIDNKYLIRIFTVIKKEEVLDLLGKITINENNDLITFNNFQANTTDYSFDSAVKTMEGFNSYKRHEYIIVEYYYSYDKYNKEYGLNKIWFEKDGKIVCNSLKSLNIDFSQK